MKTFKEEILEIIENNLEIEHDLTDFWLNKTADQIIQSLLDRLPKEKVRTVESFADKRIGEEYQPWKNGYNQCLKELTEIIKGEETK